MAVEINFVLIKSNYISLDKYDRGTVTIEIQNGETKLKEVDILGVAINENFDKIPLRRKFNCRDIKS